MSILQRINPISLAYIQALIGFSMGLILGIIIFFLEKVNPLVYSGDGLTYGYTILIISPIMGLLYGFIGGILIALLYNLFAKLIGGIKFTMKENENGKT